MHWTWKLIIALLVITTAANTWNASVSEARHQAAHTTLLKNNKLSFQTNLLVMDRMIRFHPELLEEVNGKPETNEVESSATTEQNDSQDVPMRGVL